MNYILIVDDEPLIRASLSKKIKEFSTQVFVSNAAYNGVKALEWLENNYCDICVTDVRMPLMDGLELIKNIKNKYPWMECIIVSSYDDFSYAKKGISFGILDYILKPIEQISLNEALEKTCRKIQKDRLSEANKIILKKFSSEKKKIDFWVESIKSLKIKNIDNLIDCAEDTIKTLAGDKQYNLEYLANAFLEFIVEQLRKDNIKVEYSNCGLQNQILSGEDKNRYFIDSSRNILKSGLTIINEHVSNLGNKKSRKVVEEIKDYIRTNYTKQIYLQELADHVAMSRTYISTLFKNETGSTVWNYLLRVRMEKSEELLKNTDMKCYEVAYEVGYDSEMHFSQTFKGYYGLCPLEYRKTIGS